MSNLMYLARSGLSSAQSALNVVGNNMNNAFTEGYSRQSIVLGQAGGKTTSYGFFGYGAQVDGVQRAYDGFVNNQLRSATTNFMSLHGRYSPLTRLTTCWATTHLPCRPRLTAFSPQWKKSVLTR